MYNSAWYYSLNFPPLTPTANVFAIAWAILYTLIFISLIIFIVKRTNYSKVSGYILFAIQTVLNLIWPYIFFYYQNLQCAFIEILILDLFVFLTIKNFYRISPKSAYFLIPYFLWIIFATYLNAGFVLLNN